MSSLPAKIEIPDASVTKGLLKTSIGLIFPWAGSLSLIETVYDAYRQNAQNEKDYPAALSQLFRSIEDLQSISAYSGFEMDDTLKELINHLEALFAEHCGPPPPDGNIEWALQKIIGLWNSEANRKKIESLREQVRSVEQKYTMKAVSLIHRTVKETKNIVEETRNDLMEKMTQLQQQMNAQGRYNAYAAPHVVSVGQTTATQNEMPLSQTPIDSTTDTRKGTKALVRRTLKEASESKTQVSIALGSDSTAPQKYEPEPDDPFFEVYDNPFGTWQRQDALSKIIFLSEILRDSAPSCTTATRGVEWFARANCLSRVLRTMGLRMEAFLLCGKAHELIRELAELWPQFCRSYLADSYMALSACQSGMGKRKPALTSILMALNIYRALVEEYPLTYTRALAAALNDLFLRCNALGRMEEALVAIEEVVQIRRQLAVANRREKAFNADLATSLSNLSLQLDALGREGANQSIRESVEICRGLVQKDPNSPAGDDPEVFKPGLAIALNNLFLCLRNMGEREGEVQEAIGEAVNIFRELSASHPDMFDSDLANCLRNQALCLRDVGDSEGALSASQESVRIFKRHYIQYPRSFRTRLADALDVSKLCLREAGKMEEARKVKKEAEHIRRLPYHVLSD